MGDQNRDKMFRILANTCRSTHFRVERQSTQVLRCLQAQNATGCASISARHFSISKDVSSGHRMVSNRASDSVEGEEEVPLGSKAFVDCDREAIMDLFHKVSILFCFSLLETL